MASVTIRPVDLRHTVWVDVTYEDTNGRISTVTSHNPNAFPVGRVVVTRASGVVVIDSPVPAGDVTTPISGNVDINALSIRASMDVT